MSFVFKLRSPRYFILIFFALALAHSAQASDSNVLNINNLEMKIGIISFPPFYVVNSDQTLSGIYLDILKKTLHHAKIKYRFDVYPPKRLYNNLKSGDTELLLGIKGASIYDDHVLYSTTAISQIQLRVYATGDTSLPKTKEDINDHKVITMRGYSYGRLADYFSNPKNNIDVTLTSDHRSSFLMLKENRADYVINYKHPSETALKTVKIKDLKYTNFHDIKVYFVVSKAMPNAKNIVSKLEQAYLELVLLGELEYIENND
jgi:polar amino acid transport system substrate-binding protein